ncbi:hypothetical protein [Nocardia africana]
MSAPNLPEPVGAAAEPLVIAAETEEQFRELLRKIAAHSKLTRSQIIRKSGGLSKSTVYNYVNATYTSFPNLDKVQMFCAGCRLSPGEVDQVVAVWHKLKGTVVIAETDDAIVEAELVDSDTVITTAPPPTAGVHTDAGGNNIVIGGKVGGDIHVTIHQSPNTPTPRPSIIFMTALTRTIGSIALVALTLLVIYTAVSEPEDFALFTGLFLAVAEILVVLLVMGTHIYLDREPSSRGFVELRRLLRPITDSTGGEARSPASRAHLLDRAMSWRPAAAATLAVVAGVIVAVEVHNSNQVRKLMHSWSYDDSNTTVTLSALMVGIAVLVLTSVWSKSIKVLAVRVAVRFYPVPVVFAAGIGIGTTVVVWTQCGFPVGCALIAGVLTATTAFHLVTAFIHGVIVVPAVLELREHRGGELSRHAEWIQRHAGVDPPST